MSNRTPQQALEAGLISEEHLQDATIRRMTDGEEVGFCLNCGAEAKDVGVTETGSTCSNCGEPAVSSAEEILGELEK